ncbi:MAG: hypothetical protein GWP14_04505 [Actinobacteria bacterium]|nr:hypothetical protein [Actinomycetota bacterium]
MLGNQEVQKIIGRIDTGIRLGRLIRIAIFVGLIYSLVIERQSNISNAILIGVGVVWVALGIRARRKADQTTAASQMIASGGLTQAAGMLLEVCRGFCLHKPVALMACHNLAVILQKQRQWPAAWQLCELVRSWADKRLGELRILSESVRAECSLAMNNLGATYESLSILSRLELSVTERLSVLPTEINYCLQVGQPEAVMNDLPNKVTLAAMLPTQLAGATHASMALAAHAAKQMARRDWLWERATLYCPAEELLAQRPGLQDVAKQRKS